MNNLMVIDGIEVRRDAYERYSLNDLHRAAVASGANARTKEPGKFLSSQQTIDLVHELINTQNLGVDPVSVIHGEMNGERMSVRNWCMPMQCGSARHSI